jgi:hypothetical protein
LGFSSADENIAAAPTLDCSRGTAAMEIKLQVVPVSSHYLYSKGTIKGETVDR